MIYVWYFLITQNLKSTKKKKKLLRGICCNVHVNTELLSCPVHFVLFNMNFPSAWLFNSLKFLLLLPVPTMPDDNDLFVSGFAFQARLIRKHNTQLSQQEMFAPKYAFWSWYWLHWKHPAEPQLWKQLEDQENLTLPLTAQHQPHLLPTTTGGGSLLVNGQISRGAKGCLWTWPWQGLISSVFRAHQDILGSNA